MEDGANPYLAPCCEGPPAVSARLLAERREHLAAEINIKGFAGLTVMTGLLVLLVLGIFLGLPREWPAVIYVGAVAALACTLIAAGLLLRFLLPAGRTLYSLVLVASIGFAVSGIVGTDRSPWLFILPLLMIYSVPVPFVTVLYGRRGRTILSRRYRQIVVPATCELRYRTPRWFWPLSILLVVIVSVLILSLGERLGQDMGVP